MNNQLMQQVAARGKYAPLFRYLVATDARQWRATFQEVEAVLGFSLPSSARVHRSWWSNQANGSHSHALAWHAAGWRTSAVDLSAEALVFERIDDAAAPSQRHLSIDEIFPPHDPPHDFGAGRRDFRQVASRSTAKTGGKPCSWIPMCSWGPLCERAWPPSCLGSF